MSSFAPYNVCVHFHDESLVATLWGCFLKAEMSKSNARNLLDSEEQPILPRGKLVKCILETTMTF